MFDFLVDHHKVMNVETAGDCYIVAGGIMETDNEGFYQVGVTGHKMGDSTEKRFRNDGMVICVYSMRCNVDEV